MQLIHLLTDTLSLISDTIIFDDGTLQESTLVIAPGINVSYLFLPKTDGKYTRSFYVHKNSKFIGGGIFLGSDMVQQMSIKVLGDNTTASLNLLSLVQDNAKIEVSGIGKTEPGIQNISLRIDQVNILLGENSIVRGRPVLEVATDSIKGGHSCKIHRISGEAFFYLQSHGIDSDTAEGMLLSAEIKKHTDILGKHGEAIRKEILSRLIKKSN